MASALTRRGSARWTAQAVNTFALALAALWLTGFVVEVTQDQISLWPPRPPTAAEEAAARPKAEAKWRAVHTELSRRLPSPPQELGEVWSTRTGRICGYIDDRETAVDNMTQFYTDGRSIRLRKENEGRYVRVWVECINDRWAPLHEGIEKTGFCATMRGRRSVLGQAICPSPEGGPLQR